MDDPEELTVQLTDPRAVDVGTTGGKGANLAVLIQAGFPVPPGFVVATTAYREFVAEHGLDERVAEALAGFDGDPESAEAISARLRAAFESAAVPERIRTAITMAYKTFDGAPVAVRSSATAEDLPEASFAGQQETILSVAGPADLCDAVRQCWSSLWTARAIAYRHHHGIGHERIAVAVVVQPMVHADTAGVLFTADPTTGRRDHVVVEATHGLGDALVSGQVTPDRWVVDGRSRAIIAGSDPGPRPMLTRSHLDTLVGLGLRAATTLGAPQDVEWAVAEGRCWLLQSRPITSLFPLPPGPADGGLRVYLPLMLALQGIAKPLTPAGNTFFRTLGAVWIRYLAGSHPHEGEAPPPWLPIVAGRIYLDATPMLHRRWVAAKLADGLGNKDPAASVTLHEWLDHNHTRVARVRGWVKLRGLAVSIAMIAAGVIHALVAPDRTRRRLLRDADRELTRLEHHAAELTAPLDQVDFVQNRLPVRTAGLVLRQLPAVYAQELLKLAIERLLKRWLGSASGFEPVRRWLPHDPTMAMAAALATLARDHAAAGIDPAPTSPGVAEFLATYGHRAPAREVDLGLPRFSDDPAYVVDLIRGYLRPGDPAAALAKFRAGSEQAHLAAGQLVDEVRRKRGRLRAAVLRTLVHRYRAIGGLRERPKFDMVRAIALGRHTFQRVGTTLSDAGLLDTADDVFFAADTELRAALGGQPRDLRATVAANRHEFVKELGRRAIPRILVSDGEAVYGPTTAQGAGTAGTLTGTSLSPGEYEGPVRVLDSPVGAGLQPGEIVVAATTDPGWTPLFLLAGALVMEVGGVVSHGAVVAREYGIPAVAGIADATVRLRSGQRIRVDGTNGTVTPVDPVQSSAASALTHTDWSRT